VGDVRPHPAALAADDGKGFGIHTFKLVNAEGKVSFVKFHWKPKLGIQSTIWDEALKLQAADNDYHRRDLFEAIDTGASPQWDLSIQCSIRRSPRHSLMTSSTRPS
jgi:catalase